MQVEKRTMPSPSWSTRKIGDKAQVLSAALKDAEYEGTVGCSWGRVHIWSSGEKPGLPHRSPDAIPKLGKLRVPTTQPQRLLPHSSEGLLTVPRYAFRVQE